MASSKKKAEKKTFVFHSVASLGKYLVPNADGTVGKRFTELGAWEIDGEVNAPKLYVCYSGIDPETGKPGRADFAIPANQMLQMREALTSAIETLGLESSEKPAKARKAG